MTKEDSIEIVVNGETIAKFSVPTKTDKSFGALKEYDIFGRAADDEMEVMVVLCPKKQESKKEQSGISNDILNRPTTNVPYSPVGSISPQTVPQMVSQIMIPLKQEETSINQTPTPEEPKVEPIALPEKKTRKPRTSKVTKVEESAPVVIPEENVVESQQPLVSAPVSTGDVNTLRVPTLVQLIGFYCTARKIEPVTMTIEMLKSDAGALDMIESDNDATINAALEELKKKNKK